MTTAVEPGTGALCRPREGLVASMALDRPGRRDWLVRRARWQTPEHAGDALGPAGPASLSPIPEDGP